MSLSRHLQSPEFLKSIPGKTPDELKAIILDKGYEWFRNNEAETNRIRQNLVEFGFLPDSLIPEVQKHIILHYYEKLLPLSGNSEFFYSFLKTHVNCDDAVKLINKSNLDNKGIIIALAHFGAVEFVTPSLATFDLSLNTVLRFTTEHLSEQAHKRAQQMHKSTLFGPIKFIEIGKPGIPVAMHMAAALRKKEILVSVFDEKTEYSKPVTLFGKKVSGGAGLDKIVKFANVPTDIYSAFMIRNEDDTTYRLDLRRIDPENSIQNMFDELQSVVKEKTEQWYFLHEEIPFLDN